MATKECVEHDRRIQSLEQTLRGAPGEDGLIADIKAIQKELGNHTRYFNYIVGGWFLISLAIAIHKMVRGG